ncbi:MAG: T9SS type A sorting domain-containing protein [FCB group bacterium]|nr:T9SS type A sorting domain-containing protein [FCB group bacterium]
MRCQQVRQRLTECRGKLSQLDESDLRHLRECEQCAEYAQAEMSLSRDFDRLSADDNDGGLHLSHLKTRVESCARPHRENTMSRFAGQLKNRPKTSFALVFGIVFLLFVTVVPIKMNSTVGYEVALAGVNKDLAMDGDKVQELLVAIGIDNADFELGECEKTCNLKIIDLKSEHDVQMVLTAFDELDNVELKDVFEVKIDESHNIFTHAKNVLLTDVVLQAHSEGELHEFVIQKMDALHEKHDGMFNIYFSEDQLTEEQKNALQEVHEYLGEEHFQNIKLTEYVDGEGTISFETADGKIYEVALDDPKANEIFEAHGISLGEGNNFTLDGDVVKHDANFYFDGQHVIKDADGKIYWVGTDKNGNKYKLDLNHPDFWSLLKETGDPNIDFKATAEAHGEEFSLEKPDAGALPDGFELKQNYPNPFNPTTTISYSLAESEHVRLDIINIQGQVVRTLVDESKGVGEHSVTWDSKDSQAQKVSSGIYMYRLTVGDISTAKKMTLLK